MIKTSDYTKEELNAVIDRFDMGCMRNHILHNESEMLYLLNTFGGQSAVLSLRASKLGIQVSSALHLPQLEARLKAWWESKV